MTRAYTVLVHVVFLFTTLAVLAAAAISGWYSWRMTTELPQMFQTKVAQLREAAAADEACSDPRARLREVDQLRLRDMEHAEAAEKALGEGLLHAARLLGGIGVIQLCFCALSIRLLWKSRVAAPPAAEAPPGPAPR